YVPLRRTARLSAANSPALGDGAAASAVATSAANAITVGWRRLGSRWRPFITAASSAAGKRRPGTTSLSGTGSWVRSCWNSSRGGQRSGQLLDDAYHHRWSEGADAVYVFGEGLAFGPFESEVVEAVRFAVIVGADHPRVLDPRAVPCLPQEAFHRRGVAREPRPQYLERTRPALRVLGAVHFGRASLADALEEAVAGDGPTGEVLVGHGNARN